MRRLPFEPVIPGLSPEITDAASAVARDDELNLRQHPDAESAILMTTPGEVILVWMLRGIQHDLAEAERQLLKARVGQDRWRKMQLELADKPQGRVFPMDFCPEMSREETAFMKRGDWYEFPELRHFGVTGEMADMLAISDSGEFFSDYDAKDVASSLRYFARKIDTLTRTRDALRRALPEVWPGTTDAEWLAFQKRH